MPLPCKFRTSQHIVRKEDYATIILAVLISCAGFCLNAETVIIGSMLISNLTKPFTNLVVALYKLKWKVASLSILDICYSFCSLKPVQNINMSDMTDDIFDYTNLLLSNIICFLICYVLFFLHLSVFERSQSASG